MRTTRTTGRNDEPCMAADPRSGRSAGAQNARRVAAHVIVRRARRIASERSLEVFCRTYLPHLFKLPMADFHREIIADLEAGQRQRGQRLAMAAPRWHGKSTLVGIAFPLWCALYGFEEHIVVATHDSDAARDRALALKQELIENARIRADFGALLASCPNPFDVALRTGPKIACVARGARIGSRRWRGARPTLVILDEIETRPHWTSPEYGRTAWGSGARMHNALEDGRRTRSWMMDWLDVGLAPGANVVVIGSIAGYQSHLADLLDDLKERQWTKRQWGAICGGLGFNGKWSEWSDIAKAGGSDPLEARDHARQFFEANRDELERKQRSLWPARFEIDELMALRLRADEDWFQCQIDCWPEMLGYGDSWRPYDDAWNSTISIQNDGEQVRTFVAYNPAFDREGYTPRFGPNVLLIYFDKTKKKKDAWTCWDILQHRRTFHLYKVVAELREARAKQVADGTLAEFGLESPAPDVESITA